MATPSATGTEFSVEDAGVQRRTGSRSRPASGPRSSRWRRLRRNRSRCSSAACHADRVLCLLAPVYAERHRAHRARHTSNIGGSVTVGGKSRRRWSGYRHPDRPNMARPVLLRGGRQRPRCRRAPALRRARLAGDRRGGDHHRDGPRARSSASLAGFFRGLADGVISPNPRTCIWAYPGGAAGRSRSARVRRRRYRSDQAARRCWCRPS